jgi:hypothetical protein
VEHAPRLRFQPLSEGEGEQCCPFCGKFLSRIGAGTHVKSHITRKDSGLFAKSFPCFVCERTIINGQHEWGEHVCANHNEKYWLIQDLTIGTLAKNFECLVCGSLFQRRGALTHHCWKLHVNKGTFTSHFACPRCPDHIVTSPASWSNHTETFHGKRCAPCLFPLASCPFCSKEVTPKTLHKHMRSHIPSGSLSLVFKSSFDCQLCLQTNTVAHSITGSSQWDQYVQEHHEDLQRHWLMENLCLSGNALHKKLTRWATFNANNAVACLLCPKTFAPRGLYAHFLKTH